MHPSDEAPDSAGVAAGTRVRAAGTRAWPEGAAADPRSAAEAQAVAAASARSHEAPDPEGPVLEGREVEVQVGEVAPAADPAPHGPSSG